MGRSNWAAVALVAVLGAGCAAHDGGATTVPGGVASALAVRAEGVAAALEGGRCDAALAEARALQTELAAVDLEPAVRAEALAAATRMVNGIVCAPPPPPPTTTTTAAPVTAARHSGDGDNDKKGKGRKGDDDDD